MNIQHKIPKNSKIKNIILDLDETLIYSIDIQELSKSKPKKEELKNKGKLFKYHIMDDSYIVTERPGVQKFLDFIFKHFNVSVWTAATKDYALFVIENVILKKPDRKLDFILHSDHCDYSSSKSGCPKQLNQLFHFHNYNEHNTLIIDDNKNVLEKQKNIVIPIKQFIFFKKDSEHDDQLEKTLEKIIKLCNK